MGWSENGTSKLSKKFACRKRESIITVGREESHVMAN